VNKLFFFWEALQRKVNFPGNGKEAHKRIESKQTGKRTEARDVREM